MASTATQQAPPSSRTAPQAAPRGCHPAPDPAHVMGLLSPDTHRPARLSGGTGLFCAPGRRTGPRPQAWLRAPCPHHPRRPHPRPYLHPLPAPPTCPSYLPVIPARHTCPSCLPLMPAPHACIPCLWSWPNPGIRTHGYVLPPALRLLRRSFTRGELKFYATRPIFLACRGRY